MSIMSEIERHITRSHELAVAITGIMARRNLTLEETAQGAMVSLASVRLIIEPNRHVKKKVTKVDGAKIIKFVSGTDEEEFKVSQKAGIDFYIPPGSDGSLDEIVKLL